MLKHTFSLSLLGLGAALLLGAPARASVTDCQAVPTHSGPLSGKLDTATQVCGYKGVPFAAPPPGPPPPPLPQEPTPRKEPLPALKLDKGCWRFPISFPMRPVPVGDEDCLHLNVWHPAKNDGKKRPVMFWIHGGGFVTGEGGSDFYDGTRLVNQGDVVVVTINYRLGPFGFLNHPAIVKEADSAPNLAFYDMLFALQWVQKNIGEFGGDKNNVTIFGESAGGISVAALMLSPLAKGLFHKAINQSGPLAMMQTDLSEGLKEGELLAQTVGCTNPAEAPACLRKLSARDLFMKAPSSFKLASPTKPTGPSFRYGPVVDGKILPAHSHKLFEQGKFADVPTLIGNTKDEMALFLMGKALDTKEQALAMVNDNKETLKTLLNLDFDMEKFIGLYDFKNFPTVRDAAVQASTDLAFRCPARMNAGQLARKNKQVFVYEYPDGPADKGTFGLLGAFHGSELPFVFGVFDFLGFKFDNPRNRAISDKAIALWTSFAHDGQPKAKDLPEWKPYSEDKPNGFFIGVTPRAEELKPRPGCGYLKDFLAPVLK